MKVSEALRQRKSTRAYSDRQVEQETIMHILEAAKHSPSGANHQPWQVAVVSGAAKRELQERIEQEFAAGRRGKMDYQYYPDIWPEPYKGRRIACGVQLYDALAIARGDKQRRLRAVGRQLPWIRRSGDPLLLSRHQARHRILCRLRHVFTIGHVDGGGRGAGHLPAGGTGRISRYCPVVSGL
jgi:nitroreductase